MEIHSSPSVKSTSLTPLQLGMLFHVVEDPTSGTYISQAVANMDRLQPDLYDKAWNYLIARHEILRAAVDVQEKLEDSKLVFFEEVKIKSKVVSLVDKSPSRQSEAIKALQREERNVGFNLAAAPLIRLVYIQLSDIKWAVLNTHSHLILDGWSGGILGKELSETYEKMKRGNLPEFAQPKQFTDYIKWLEKREQHNDLGFWQQRLSDIYSTTPLPWEPSRHQLQSNTVDSCVVDLSDDESTLVQDFAKNQKVTVNVIIESAWAFLLANYAGLEKIVYGLVVSGRPHSLSGVEDIVGMFLNTVPIYVRLDHQETISEFIVRLQNERYDSQEYEHTPLLDIKKSSNLKANHNVFNSIVARKDVSQEGRVGLRSRRASSSRARSTQATFKQNTPFLLNIQITNGIELKLTFHKDYITKSHAQLILRQLSYIILKFCECSSSTLSTIQLSGEHPSTLGIIKSSALSSQTNNDLLTNQNDNIADLDTLLACFDSLSDKHIQCISIDNQGLLSSLDTEAYLHELRSRLFATSTFPLANSTSGFSINTSWLKNSTAQSAQHYLFICGEQTLIESSFLFQASQVNSKITFAFPDESSYDFHQLFELHNFTAVIASHSILCTLLSSDLVNKEHISRWICVSRLPITYSLYELFKSSTNRSSLMLVNLDRHGIPILTWNDQEDPINKNEAVFGRPYQNQQLILLDSCKRIAPFGVPSTLHQCIDLQNAEGPYSQAIINGNSISYSEIPDQILVTQNNDHIVVSISTYRCHKDVVRSLGQHSLIESAIREITQIPSIYIAYSTENILVICIPTTHQEALTQIMSQVNASMPNEYCPKAAYMYDAPIFSAELEIDRAKLLAGAKFVDIASLSLLSSENKSELEEKVHSVWTDVLRNTAVSLDDNFFVLGGHSLSATRVSSRLTKILDKHVPIRAIFEAPTIRSLAYWIETHENESELSATIATRPDAVDAPTTFTQQQLWILGQMFTGMAAYSIPSNIKYNGELRIDLLQSSLLWIVDRHQILRTIFKSVDGEPRQVVLDTPNQCPVYHFDLSREPISERDLKSKAIIRQEARRNWQLDEGPLFRCIVISLTSSEHIICTIFHHIIADGPSVGIFSRELERIYSALVDGKSDDVRLPDLKLQYSDYAYWERDSIQGDLFEQQLSYWRTKLDLSIPLEVPTDFPRPAVHNFAGKKVKFVVGLDDLKSIKELCRQKGCTLFVYFVSCYQYILHLYSSQDDVMIGTAMTNRVRSELEPLIGLFVNTLPLRTQFKRDWTFDDLIEDVRDTCVGAFSNMELPFEETVNVIQPVRDLSKQGSPLFQHMIINQPPGRARQAKDSSFEPGESHHDTGYSNFDLLLSTHEIEDTRIDCTLAYDTELFREDTIDRFINLFNAIVKDFSRISSQKLSSYKLVTSQQEKTLLDEWSGSSYQSDNYTLLDQIKLHAEQSPDSIALSCGDLCITYLELYHRVEGVAAYLDTHFQMNQQFVAVCLPKSINAIVAILAVMSCRGIVVALDPGSPVERINYILDDAGVNLLISSDSFSSTLELGDDVELCDVNDIQDKDSLQSAQSKLVSTQILAQDAAYMIYTSGSTGKPKGVVIEHRNLTSTIKGQVQAFDVRSSDRILQILSLGFDAAFGEIFRCFYAGAHLVLPDIPKLLPSQEMIDLFVEQNITIAAMSASMLAALPDPSGFNFSLRTLIIGGEACPTSVASKWKTICQLINGYGPTETTIGATYCSQWPSGTPAPLGRPLPGVKVYVLDSSQKLVPPDIVGELYIGGNAVGRCYFNRPELTAEKFLKDPFSALPNARMYKTGDRVKWRGDGQLDFVGRVDNQVKIRGYRVELGEIEAASSNLHGVQQAGVLVVKKKEQARLALYLKQKNNLELTAADIRDSLRNLLPEYMVPTYIIFVPEIPLNSSGKLDKNKLPEPIDDDINLSTEFVEPANDLEQSLAQLWSTVLGVERVGRNDNFFELGGDSISCIRVSSRASELGMAIDPKLLFQNQTIQLLADKLDSTKSG